MRKETIRSSFMPLPLNFSEKSPGTRSVSIQDPNYWSQILYALGNNIFMNEKKVVTIQDCYYGTFNVKIKKLLRSFLVILELF